MANNNKTIGRFHLDNIPPAPRGVPQIEIAFDTDANDIINISVTDKGTDKSHNICTEASPGFSKEDIEKMKREAEANAEADKKAKERADKLNEADAMIFQTERQLKESGDKLPADKKGAIEGALSELKTVHDNKDLGNIEAALDKINTVWQQVSEDPYRAQQGGATGQPNAGGQRQQGGNTDNVQDIDFEEVR